MEENKRSFIPDNPLTLPVIREPASCCGGGDPAVDEVNSAARLNQPFVSGSTPTPAGPAPMVTSVLTRQDRRGTIRARLGVFRMNYSIHPGLYALGIPDEQSPVLVTANYKMSFDRLRNALPNRDAWILVLDTKGINVWCAAGKGTFGTRELIKRLELSGLKNIVSHRKIILPQLGAPGIAAHQIRQSTGFTVHYGPVRAEDLPAYLDAGFKADQAMRRVTFPMGERAVLIPIELRATVKPFVFTSFVLLILAGILGQDGFLANLLRDGLFAVIALFTAVVAGAVLSPLLLPWLPGRAFSTKGLFIGLFAALLLMIIRDVDIRFWSGRMEILAWLMIIPAVATYLTMNFTGASTYTSLSGVKKEMRFALPLEITAGVIGLAAWITSFLVNLEL